MNFPSRHREVLAASLALLAAGCPPRQWKVDDPPPPARPLGETVRRINHNVGLATGTLRAICDVDGVFRDADGVMRHYNLDGILFILPPHHFRFSLKSLGDTRFIMGTNELAYWFLDPKNAENNYCGTVSDADRYPEELPIRPDQIVDALALRPLPVSEDSSFLLVQRVEGANQQILFVSREGNPVLSKEYWVETRAPDVIRRALFRDALGDVEMDAQLSDHTRLVPGGPVLPGRIFAEWPRRQARLRIQIRRWTIVPEVTADSVQFETPSECPDS